MSVKLSQSTPPIPDFRLIIVGTALLNGIYKNGWINPQQYQHLRDSLNKDIQRGIKELCKTLVNLTQNSKNSINNREHKEM